MFTQQQTYNYFDSTLNQAIPIEYSGTQDLDGLQVYVFKQSIPGTQYTEQEVPGSLVDSPDASFKAPRFYSNERELLVEPNTGSIIGGTEQQKQWLTGPDGTEKVVIIQATISTTQETKQVGHRRREVLDQPAQPAENTRAHRRRHPGHHRPGHRLLDHLPPRRVRAQRLSRTSRAASRAPLRRRLRGARR
jgi:hypothetical protein